MEAEKPHERKSMSTLPPIAEETETDQGCNETLVADIQVCSHGGADLTTVGFAPAVESSSPVHYLEIS